MKGESNSVRTGEPIQALEFLEHAGILLDQVRKTRDWSHQFTALDSLEDIGITFRSSEGQLVEQQSLPDDLAA